MSNVLLTQNAYAEAKRQNGSEIFSVVCFIILKGLKSLAFGERRWDAKNGGVMATFMVPHCYFYGTSLLLLWYLMATFMVPHCYFYA